MSNFSEGVPVKVSLLATLNVSILVSTLMMYDGRVIITCFQHEQMNSERYTLTTAISSELRGVSVCPSVRPSVRTSYSRTVDSIAEFCHRVNLPAACTDLRSLAVLLPAQTQPWSSRDSVVRVTDLHPINLASTLAGIQMSHWWWQEGHPAKTDPVHYRKVSLHM